MIVSNVLRQLSPPLGALILSAPNSPTFLALSSTCYMKSVHFVVRVALWAMRTIRISVAFIPRLYAGKALPMAGPDINIGVVLGVLVALRAMGYIGFPATPISDFILSILAGRSPVEIAQMIVLWIVITMTALGLRRPRAYEGLQHQRMNCHGLRLAIAIQRAGSVFAISRSASKGLRQQSAGKHPRCTPPAQALSINRPHLPMIRNFIARITGDRQPDFITACHRWNHSILGGL
jgi:hypothetical protein